MGGSRERHEISLSLSYSESGPTTSEYKTSITIAYNTEYNSWYYYFKKEKDNLMRDREHNIT